MRPEASLMGAGVPRETACCQWFPGGQAQDLTGEVSKAWCDTIVAMAMEVNAVR